MEKQILDQLMVTGSDHLQKLHKIVVNSIGEENFYQNSFTNLKTRIPLSVTG